MRLLLWLALLMVVLVVNSNPVPKPIHALLKYYKKEEQKQQERSHSKLRHRCESQRFLGGFTSAECQKWISDEYRMFNSGSKTSTTLSLTILATIFIRSII